MPSPGVLRSWFIVCCIVALTTFSSSQEGTPTIRSSSELVLVPVVVKDRYGKSVGGLKASDFSVLVENKPQPVAQFEEVRANASKVPEITSVKGGAFRNTALRTSGPVQSTIILLDLVNTPFLYQTLARTQLIEFLSKDPHPGESISILALSGSGLRQVHGFSNDRGSLIAALEKIHSELNRATIDGTQNNRLAETISDPVDEDSLTSFLEQDFRQALIASQQQLTLEAMVQVAEAMRTVPGRKNLVWTTAGFPFYLYEPRALSRMTFGSTADYDSVWRRLNDANISVYPVDVRGVFDPLWHAIYAPENGTADASAAEDAKSDDWSVRTTMRSFAEATGGNACLGQNEMGRCYADVLDDSSDYYMLSFYLPPEMRKEGWHKLKVRVQGGYQVRARQGFTVGDHANQASTDLEMIEALRSPMENDGLAISLELGSPKMLREGRRVLPVPAPEKKKTQRARFPVATVPFKIKLERGLIAVDTEQQNHIAVRVDVAAVTENNEVLAVFSKEITGNITTDGVKQLAQQGFTFADDVALPAGKLRVRFAVMDEIGRRLGTVEAPVTIGR